MLIYLQMIETGEDKSKFEQIYLEYRRLMFYIAYQRLQHKEDAEDVVHHVFVKIAENIKSIEPVTPKTEQFVVTMLNNQVTDLFRKRGRHPEVIYNDKVLNDLSAHSESENLLVKCIFELSDQQRQVIWLKYYYGYKLREIAKMLDISLAWAQKIDQRAKKKLKKLYKEGGGL